MESDVDRADEIRGAFDDCVERYRELKAEVRWVLERLTAEDMRVVREAIERGMVGTEPLLARMVEQTIAEVQAASPINT